MKNRDLTVFTPTYNRAYTLTRLYESLKRQTNQNFTWLVVDDGSTDETQALIDSFVRENILDIRYVYQENAGKMQAHNRAAEACDTALFVCVDSDDYLTDTAVDELIQVWNGEKSHHFSGIAAYKGLDAVTNLGKGAFPSVHSCTLKELSSAGFQGDTTLCFNTSVLRKFSFPQIPGEKFLSESYLYDQIDQQYQCIVYPRILTICEYLEDGYSRNMNRISFQNPIGRMYHEAQNMVLSKTLKQKLQAAIRYDMYKAIARHEHIKRFSLPEKIVLAGLYPIGYLCSVRKRKQVEKCL